MRVTVTFTCWGMAMNRVWQSMKKYIPDDVEIVQSLAAGDKFIGKSDLLITHLGMTEYNPYLAFISPKVVLSERADAVAASYFGKKDILFSFHPDEVVKLKKMGVNAVLWPRPVDDEVFYPTEIPRDNLALTVDASHGDWVYRANTQVARAGGQHTILHGKGGKPALLPGLDTALFDYCNYGEEDKLRTLYDQSKYTMSIQGMVQYRECRTAGIEIGNMEAIFCGSTPILLDMDGGDYLKYWYGDYAKFVSIENFDEELYDILNGEYTPLTSQQISNAVARCNAEKVWIDFWDAVSSS